MKEMISSVLVLTIICAVSALLLTGIRNSTSQQRENQELQHVKGPAITKVLAGSTNDPLAVDGRVKVPMDDGSELTVFVGKFDGKPKIGFESQGKGYGGDVKLIVGIDPESDTLVGIGVTTHKETPGVGSRVKTDESYGKQFVGLSVDENIAVKADGGIIDAISGATVSSKASCAAVKSGLELYTKNKDKILSAIQKVQ
ncbi:RnfABCDGE type electron transport complex subunit G [bacterium]|nr:RnfABCDGE type electron transport complex subunit G [bacterium]